MSKKIRKRPTRKAISKALDEAAQQIAEYPETSSALADEEVKALKHGVVCALVVAKDILDGDEFPLDGDAIAFAVMATAYSVHRDRKEA